MTAIPNFADVPLRAARGRVCFGHRPTLVENGLTGQATKLVDGHGGSLARTPRAASQGSA